MRFTAAVDTNTNSLAAPLLPVMAVMPYCLPIVPWSVIGAPKLSGLSARLAFVRSAEPCGRSITTHFL